MKGFERARESKPSQRSEAGWTLADTPEVQIQLALLAYRKRHHETGVDIARWSKNTKSIQAEAMAEWYADPDDPASYAGRFRAHLKAHPHKAIDVSNTADLEAFLTEIANQKVEIH
jgi:hypothetical protein